MRFIVFLAVCVAFIAAAGGVAAEPDPKGLVQKVVKAAGGEDKLLKLFRIKERLNVSPDPAKKQSPASRGGSRRVPFFKFS